MYKNTLNKRKWTTEEISELCKKKDFLLIHQYIKGKYRRIVIQDVFGYKYDVGFSAFLENKKCIVGKNNPFSLDNISIWLKINQKNFILSENNKYIDALKNKLSFKCLQCGEVFKMNWGNVSQNQGCPNCKKSKGESEVKRVLDKLGIKYISQYWYSDCRNINPLPFDFYLLDYNTCIEYHGHQHYRLRKDDLFGGEKAFKERKQNDLTKEKYCQKNNINLLVISYCDFKKIEYIISEYIKGG